MCVIVLTYLRKCLSSLDNRTIIYLSIVYTIGQAVLSVGSINDLTDHNRDGSPDSVALHMWVALYTFYFPGWWRMGQLTFMLLEFQLSFNHSITYALRISTIFFSFLLCSSALSMIGLILIALGTGGIKPCVSAFGGDQFEEDQVTMSFRFSVIQIL